ncbi:g2283 [Coccomyxa elongata]
MEAEKRADFDKGNGVIPFSVTGGSPRKKGRKEETLMKRTAKAGEEAKNVKQARLKGEEGDMTQSLTGNQPSSREIAAAKAARARLYSKAQGQEAEASEARLPTGDEPSPSVDVAHIPTEQLTPLDNPKADAQAALLDLQSSDWAIACRGQVQLRRLAVFHPLECRPLLPQAIPLVLKSVKNLRSSLSKAAIMAVSDLCRCFGSELLPLMDVGGAAQPLKSLLSQLLLKAGSNDKRFVIEEVTRALQTMADYMDPPRLLQRLLPYAAHKNPKVRGKVAVSLAASAAKMTPEQWARLDHAPLLQAAGKLVSDNTPEAREAAKRLISMLRDAFDASGDAGCGPSDAAPEGNGKENAADDGNAARLVPAPDAPGPVKGGGNAEENVPWSRWAHHCRSTLGSTSAAAVLKVSS